MHICPSIPRGSTVAIYVVPRDGGFEVGVTVEGDDRPRMRDWFNSLVAAEDHSSWLFGILDRHCDCKVKGDRR